MAELDLNAEIELPGGPLIIPGLARLLQTFARVSDSFRPLLELKAQFEPLESSGRPSLAEELRDSYWAERDTRQCPMASRTPAAFVSTPPDSPGASEAKGAKAPKLYECHHTAAASYALVLKARRDLEAQGSWGVEALRPAYEWMVENGSTMYPENVPSLRTWASYLRKALRDPNAPKATPRTGRTCGSAVGVRDI